MAGILTIYVLIFFKTNVKDVLQTPSRTSGSKIRATPRIKVLFSASKTPFGVIWTYPNLLCFLLFCLDQSFRIRTPPSSEKSVPWRKATLELDPKSDSSEADLLVMCCFFPSPLHPYFSVITEASTFPYLITFACDLYQYP